jgi:post-segregation antitoxin (ccd killing protein)
MAVTVQLTQEDINLLVEALDAYEYWEAGDPQPRNNGSVFIPGDLRPEDDRYWGPEPSPNETELEAIERVRACRDVGDRLVAIRDVATDRYDDALALGVYSLCMARRNISLPDDLDEQARRARLNVSALAQRAVAAELDRRERMARLDAWLDELDAEHGEPSAKAMADARKWVASGRQVQRRQTSATRKRHAARAAG